MVDSRPILSPLDTHIVCFKRRHILFIFPIVWCMFCYIIFWWTKSFVYIVIATDISSGKLYPSLYYQDSAAMTNPWEGVAGSPGIFAVSFDSWISCKQSNPLLYQERNLMICFKSIPNKDNRLTSKTSKYSPRKSFPHPQEQICKYSPKWRSHKKKTISAKPGAQNSHHLKRNRTHKSIHRNIYNRIRM